MNPEEAGQAWQVLGARHMLPIHYGTFRLTEEPVGEPPLRLRAWWEAEASTPPELWLPRLGETRRLADRRRPRRNGNASAPATRDV